MPPRNSVCVVVLFFFSSWVALSFHFLNVIPGTWYVPCNIHFSFCFVDLKAWRKHLDANADPRCVSVVAGNKSDMEEQDVSPEEGVAYAKEVGWVCTGIYVLFCMI